MRRRTKETGSGRSKSVSDPRAIVPNWPVGQGMRAFRPAGGLATWRTVKAPPGETYAERICNTHGIGEAGFTVKFLIGE